MHWLASFLPARGLKFFLIFGMALVISGSCFTTLNVTGPPNGTYENGEFIDFTVTYSTTVTVDTTGGAPFIDLTIGSSSRQASYLSGSGSSTLTFRYIVQGGDLDTDGIASTSPIQLNGGTITDDTCVQPA